MPSYLLAFFAVLAASAITIEAIKCYSGEGIGGLNVISTQDCVGNLCKNVTYVGKANSFGCMDLGASVGCVDSNAGLQRTCHCSGEMCNTPNGSAGPGASKWLSFAAISFLISFSLLTNRISI